VEIGSSQIRVGSNLRSRAARAVRWRSSAWQAWSQLLQALH